MSILNAIDIPISFLFVSHRGTSLIRAAQNFVGLTRTAEIGQAYGAKYTYEKQIRNYFGLGFLLSFIPNTNAFKSRLEYMRSQQVLKQCLNHWFDPCSAEDDQRAAKRWLPIMAMTPFSFLQGYFYSYASIITRVIPHIIKNQSHEYRLGVLINYLPILSDLERGRLQESTNHPMLSPHKKKYWLWTIQNPVRLISSLLHFGHTALNAWVDMGNINLRHSTPMRMVAKSVIALIFVPVRLAVKTIEETINLAWSLSYQLVVNPFIFLFSAINQSWNHSNVSEEAYVYASKYQLGPAKAISKILRGKAQVGQSVGAISTLKNESDTKHYIPMDEYIERPRQFFLVALSTKKKSDQTISASERAQNMEKCIAILSPLNRSGYCFYDKDYKLTQEAIDEVRELYTRKTVST